MVELQSGWRLRGRAEREESSASLRRTVEYMNRNLDEGVCCVSWLDGEIMRTGWLYLGWPNGACWRTLVYSPYVTGTPALEDFAVLRNRRKETWTRPLRARGPSCWRWNLETDEFCGCSAILARTTRFPLTPAGPGVYEGLVMLSWRPPLVPDGR